MLYVSHCLASNVTVNLSSSDTLSTYLSAFSQSKPSSTSGQSSLTAGAIAGIAISAGLVIIVTMVVMLVLSIKIYRSKKHFKSL